MAKFCGNCGAQLDDDAKVCGQCGTPLDENFIRVSGLKATNSEKKKKIRKRIRFCVCFIILAVITIAAVNVVSNFTGRKGLVRKVMTAYKNYDIDTLISLSSDMYSYSEEYAVESYFENSVGNDLDAFEASVGHSYKLSYEIDEIYDLSERKLDEMFDSIEYLYPDFDISVIKDISVADISVTVKQGNKSQKRNVRITMSREGEDWKLLYID